MCRVDLAFTLALCLEGGNCLRRANRKASDLRRVPPSLMFGVRCSRSVLHVFRASEEQRTREAALTCRPAASARIYYR